MGLTGRWRRSQTCPSVTILRTRRTMSSHASRLMPMETMPQRLLAATVVLRTSTTLATTAPRAKKMETAAGRLRTAAWTMTMMMDTQFSRLRSVFAVRTDATMKTQFLRFQQRRLLLAVQGTLLELSSQSYSLSFSKSEGIVLLLLCI